MEAGTHVVTPELFYKRLTEGVESPDLTAAALSLECFLSQLTERLPNGVFQAEIYLARFFRDAPVDVKRLHRNACALVAAALAAVTAKEVSAGLVSCDLLVAKLAETGLWIGGATRHDAAQQACSWKHLDPAALVEDVSETLSRAGWCIAAAASWTLFWLKGTAGTPLHSISTLVAASRIHPAAQTRHGFLADLRLELVSGPGGQLFEHPKNALMFFGGRLLDGVRRTLTYADYAVRWSMEIRDPGIPRTEVLDGDSLSGAAAVGGRLLVQKRYPDRGVIWLTTAEPQSLPLTMFTELGLGGVGHVADKVEALAEDDRIDTILVATEENKREAEGALAALRKRLRAPLDIRVINVTATDHIGIIAS